MYLVIPLPGMLCRPFFSWSTTTYHESVSSVQPFLREWPAFSSHCDITMCWFICFIALIIWYSFPLFVCLFIYSLLTLACDSCEVKNLVFLLPLFLTDGKILGTWWACNKNLLNEIINCCIRSKRKRCMGL